MKRLNCTKLMIIGSLLHILCTGPLALAKATVQQQLDVFYAALIPTAMHNGTTLDSLVVNTNCRTLPKKPFVNDPDGNAVFAAQSAYCSLMKNEVTVNREDKDLKKYLVAGQLQRIKYIVSLHDEGAYTSSSQNPNRKEWKQLILNKLKPASFGAVEVEIQKVLKARDELETLGVGSAVILIFIEE